MVTGSLVSIADQLDDSVLAMLADVGDHVERNLGPVIIVDLGDHIVLPRVGRGYLDNENRLGSLGLHVEGGPVTMPLDSPEHSHIRPQWLDSWEVPIHSTVGDHRL